MNQMPINRAMLTAAVLGFASLGGAASAETADSGAAQQSASKMPFQLGAGKRHYDRLCAECHGGDLKGSEQGPPLIHAFYKPGHHGDAAFLRAALQGTRQHHWNFGDMEPVPGADQRKVTQIIQYVRWAQQAAGLY